MPEVRAEILRKRLLDAGVAPEFVARAVSEIEDHLQDVASESARAGASFVADPREAERRLGDLDTIVAAYSARRELKSWPSRYPRLAILALPAACALLYPLTTIDVGTRYAGMIGRWCVCFVGGGVVTAAILLLLQLGITLT